MTRERTSIRMLQVVIEAQLAGWERVAVLPWKPSLWLCAAALKQPTGRCCAAGYSGKVAGYKSEQLAVEAEGQMTL